MKLYRISVLEDALYEDAPWDVYVGAVVVAKDEDQARHMYPDDSMSWDAEVNGWYKMWKGKKIFESFAWESPEDVKVMYLGETSIEEPQVILTSYKAG